MLSMQRTFEKQPASVCHSPIPVRGSKHRESSDAHSNLTQHQLIQGRSPLTLFYHWVLVRKSRVRVLSWGATVFTASSLVCSSTGAELLTGPANLANTRAKVLSVRGLLRELPFPCMQQTRLLRGLLSDATRDSPVFSRFRVPRKSSAMAQAPLGRTKKMEVFVYG